MKHIYIALIVIISGLQTLHAQDINPVDSVILQKEHVVGRWIEKSRFVNQGDTVPAQPYTYIFKEDQMFHRGTTTNDVLIFNVTGRFDVLKDRVTISYRDYLSRRLGANKERTMTLRILAWSEKQMTAIVIEPYACEYMVVLTKQEF